MFNSEFFDMKKTFEETVEAQEQVIKGIETMMEARDDESNQTEREVVYTEDKLTLYHYKKTTRTKMSVPTLIVYALVNTPAMMDIRQDRSFIKNLVDGNMDVYLIEWGYPTPEDRYLTMDDYINGYINNCVDYILEETGRKNLNILSVCQGGTFSLIYSALHPEKVKNLITMVTPVDFSADDGLLFKWGKYLNADRMVEAYGNVPGEFLNTGFVTLRPLSLMVNKYVDLIDDLDNPNSISNFLTMERWIFDSPDQAGEAFRQFLNDCFRDNLLIKGELEVGGQKVDLKKVTQPILNLVAGRDNQVPPSASLPLEKYVGSKDVTTEVFPTGHIGLFVSGRSQREVAPLVIKWSKERVK